MHALRMSAILFFVVLFVSGTNSLFLKFSKKNRPIPYPPYSGEWQSHSIGPYYNQYPAYHRPYYIRPNYVYRENDYIYRRQPVWKSFGSNTHGQQNYDDW